METETKIKIGALLLLLGVIITYNALWYGSKEIKEVTIDEKWIKYHNNDAKYLFSDTEGNVYSIEDSLLLWSWNASDRYAFIKPNTPYEITTYGWRIPILSSYPNAIKIQSI